MTPLESRKMSRLVRGFARRRVCVLGDIMLDKYIWGSVTRISPEAPVPVVAVERDSSHLGGAGNVGNNLESLGAATVLVGVVGDDEAGRWIRRRVSDGRGIMMDKARPTTVKTRIIAHHQQVVRVDQEKKGRLSERDERRILGFLRGQEFEGLILSDYDKGVLTEGLLAGALALAKERGLIVTADPKVFNFPRLTGVSLVTPNHHEAERIVNHECRTDKQVEQAGREILRRIGGRWLILKRGEQGMSVFEPGRPVVHIPAVAREVFDVTGAGDTVIATATLALLSGATILEAATLANAAAGIVVEKIGTATVTPDELLAAIERLA